jgi:glucose dehydrogenase
MKRLWPLLAAALMPAIIAGCSNTTQPAAKAGAGPVAAPSPVKEEDKQWGMQNKDYASTRYSTLNSINTGNIKDLKVCLLYTTPSPRDNAASRMPSSA